MLCCAQRRRASRVVQNGSLLSCIKREEPRLSFVTIGEEPLTRASFGMRYKSPLPLSTYAPASRMSSHINSGRDSRWVPSTDELPAAIVAIDTSLGKVALSIV